MKLVISIVNGDDAHDLTDALKQQGFQTTKISTTGGFLREGNATIIVGIEDDKVSAVAVLTDTGPVPEVVEALAHWPRLRAVFLECSFPDHKTELAGVTQEGEIAGRRLRRSAPPSAGSNPMNPEAHLMSE